MKKYTSGAFESTTYGIYKSAQDTITSFPAEIIGNGGNITPWTIYGNMTQSNSCGERTPNLLFLYKEGYYIDTTGTEQQNAFYNLYYQSVSEGEDYTINAVYGEQGSSTIRIYGFNNGIVTSLIKQVNANTVPITFTVPLGTNEVKISFRKEITNGMLNIGETALPYEPYGYKIPVVIGSTSYPIYISEPLRKTLDGSNLYDTISSSGTLTRRSDSSGDALATPTTESITVPTLPTSGLAQTFTIDTTLKPSSVELTYTGWHRYDDKKAPWTTAKTRRKKKSV